MREIYLTQNKIALIDDADFDYDKMALLCFGEFAYLNFKE